MENVVNDPYGFPITQIQQRQQKEGWKNFDFVEMKSLIESPEPAVTRTAWSRSQLVENLVVELVKDISLSDFNDLAYQLGVLFGSHFASSKATLQQAGEWRPSK